MGVAEEEARVAGDDGVVPCEVYSRIVGYLRPVGSWNLGKQQEYAERVTYNAATGGYAWAHGDEDDEARDD